MRFNIAIDGPSAAGKSTVADIVAEKLSYLHLDTGAMYRSVALAAIKNNIKLDDEEQLLKVIDKMHLEMLDDGRVLLDGVDVSDELRNNEVSMAASEVSKHNSVRQAMVKMQQDLAKNGGYILDGRDIGTVVLPNAEIKIFLVANSYDRAMRRYKQDLASGKDVDFQTILEDIEKRDYQDTHRAVSPLRKAEDAIEIDSSKLSIDEVVDRIMTIIDNKFKDSKGV